MLIIKLWTKASRCRRFNMKRLIISQDFFIRVYFNGKLSAFFMLEFVFGYCLAGRVKGDLSGESITLIGSA